MASKGEVTISDEGSLVKLTNEEKDFYLHIEPQTGYHLSLFMVGITGAGKSSFCNFLCNKKVFEEGGGFMSVSQVAATCRFHFASREVLIIDSPGFCDSIRSDADIFSEICKVGVMAKDGTDAIALVINANDRFSENHRKAFLIMEQLGGSFWEHTFIVFTNECDALKRLKAKSGKEYMKIITQNPKCPPVLIEMLEKTDFRYLFVDSIANFRKYSYRNEKCAEIFKFIEEIQINNGYKRYNNHLMNQGKLFFNEIEKARIKEKKLQDELNARTKQLEQQVKHMRAVEKMSRKKVEEVHKQEEWRRQETVNLRKVHEQIRNTDHIKYQLRLIELEIELKNQSIKELELKDQILAKEKKVEEQKKKQMQKIQAFEIEQGILMAILDSILETELEAQKYKQNVADVAKKKSWKAYFRKWPKISNI